MKKLLGIFLAVSINLGAMDSETNLGAEAESSREELTEITTNLKAILQEHAPYLSLEQLNNSSTPMVCEHLSQITSNIIRHFDTFAWNYSVPKNTQDLQKQLCFMLSAFKVSLLQDYTLGVSEEITIENGKEECRYFKMIENPMQVLLRIDSLPCFQLIMSLRPDVFKRKSFIGTLLSYRSRKEPSQIKAELEKALATAS